MKIVCFVGTRPEAIKMAPVIRELKDADWCSVEVVLSGQHRELLATAMQELDTAHDDDMELMQPDQSLGALTGRAHIAFEKKILESKPDLVMAQGDTTTVMVAALSSFYHRIPFAHVEAGLRTGDKYNPFPEEINRAFVGKVADFHFAPTLRAVKSLKSEGVREDRIYLTGNTVIDNLAYFESQSPAGAADDSTVKILLTSHRRENFGAPMAEYFAAIRDVVTLFPQVRVVYPVHPNPTVQKLANDLLAGSNQIDLVEPLGYRNFIREMQSCDIVVTDSGGVQEEAPFFSKPVLVLRQETERPEAVDAGVAKLIGTDRDTIVPAISRLITDPEFYQSMAKGASPYGDGKASQRIAQILGAEFGKIKLTSPVEPFDAKF